MSALDQALASEGLAPTLKPPTLEEVLCGPEWFGLETASPLQRAICRWAEGLPVDHEQLAADLAEMSKDYAPDIAERMQLSWVLGGADVRVTERPELLVIDAGIRTGKSQMAAAGVGHRALTVPIPANIAPHEIIRDSTVSVDKDKAQAVLMHLRGLFDRNQQLSAAKTRDVTEGIDMERPEGHTLQLRVVHGGTSGRGLVSFWHIGATFDEASRMAGEDDAKVNLDDMMDAVEHRVLRGGQVWWISSPHAPMGPFYDVVEAYYGKPGRILVIKAPGPALNPVTWSPEECERARERKRKGIHDEKKGSFDTDVLGNWGTPESMMFDADLLASVMPEPTTCTVEGRAAELLEPNEFPPIIGETYVAAMDPSGRGGNAWTLVIGGKRLGDSKPRLMLARQWFPEGVDGKRESDVLRAIKPLLELYGVRHVYTDQYAPGFVESLALEVGIYMTEVRRKDWDEHNKLDAFDSLKTMMRERRVELVPEPLLVRDMKHVKRKLTQKGATIVFPTTGDGRHCDYAPAVAMWAATYQPEPTKELTKEEKRARWEQESEDEEFRDEPIRRRLPNDGRRRL